MTTPAPYRTDGTGVVVRPGDSLILILQPQGQYTPQECDRMKADAEASLPGVNVYVVEGVGQALVYRPEPEVVQ